MKFLSSIVSVFQKNNKFAYYFGNYVCCIIPRFILKSGLSKQLRNIDSFDYRYIRDRVNYYNKLNQIKDISTDAVALKNFRYGIKPKTYFFDSFRFLRLFPSHLRVSYLFGDVTYVPSVPAFVKSRPIGNDNENAVLLKLNKVRHFLLIHDKTPFHKKKNMLVWRGSVYQKNREDFLEKYFGSPLCDVGKVNNDRNDLWLVKRMTINEHLRYKFILCLEGNDVASNLKWVMSSNSIAVMPRPRYETWFMEGNLKRDVHYIEIKDDYSDLEEKLNHYIKHSDKAEQIIQNAHKHVDQFKNRKRENLISVLTILKYFEKTGQNTGVSINFSNHTHN